jgi:acetolactate synthase-1/2/3 large subunit
MTISHYRLPVKVFVYNNRGYASIRSTQRTFFEGRLVGADPGSGVDNPDFEKLAAAYGLGYARISAGSDVRTVLDIEGPALGEVEVSPDQAIAPRASSFRRPDGTFESRPLEDMAPFLPREEVWENMHLFDKDEASQK